MATKQPTEIDKTNNSGQNVDNSTTTAKPFTKVRLKREHKAFADYLINNPKSKPVDAVREVYNNKTDNSNYVTASRLLKNDKIMSYLESYASKAEQNMIELEGISRSYAKQGGKDGASYASVAVAVNKDILDRVHGKATQRVEQITTGVTLNIDLTGNSSDDTSQAVDK